jgi:aspartyl aminopeptidase
MVAAQLGMPTVDVGNAMWAMHSIRESAGVIDHEFMTLVLKQHYQS